MLRFSMIVDIESLASIDGFDMDVAVRGTFRISSIDHVELIGELDVMIDGHWAPMHTVCTCQYTASSVDDHMYDAAIDAYRDIVWERLQ